MKIIIIDGWHTGEVIDLSSPPPVLTLLKPNTVTECLCNPDNEKWWEEPVKNIEYRPCFRSIDNKVAFYSTTGRSEDIFRWFTLNFRKRPYNKTETLYFNCHDKNAF